MSNAGNEQTLYISLMCCRFCLELLVLTEFSLAVRKRTSNKSTVSRRSMVNILTKDIMVARLAKDSR